MLRFVEGHVNVNAFLGLGHEVPNNGSGTPRNDLLFRCLVGPVLGTCLGVVVSHLACRCPVTLLSLGRDRQGSASLFVGRVSLQQISENLFWSVNVLSASILE